MTLRLTPYKQGSIKTFTTLLCDGFVVEGLQSVRALAERLREEAQHHPGYRLFTTLDDFGQASYTSGHATDRHELDSIEGHDLSELDPSAFQDGEHVGYFTAKSEFRLRLRNLLQKAEEIRRPKLDGKLNWGPDAKGLGFLSLNANPDAILQPGERAYVQIVPVAHACEAIAAFPNGYFDGDLDPMEIYVLAKHLEEKYGYTLFGIGASYVGFMRTRTLQDLQRAALARDILALYSNAPGNMSPRVLQTISGSELLMIGYTNS